MLYRRDGILCWESGLLPGYAAGDAGFNEMAVRESDEPADGKSAHANKPLKNLDKLQWHGHCYYNVGTKPTIQSGVVNES